jgi:LPS export ABC transporter permease LptG
VGRRGRIDLDPHTGLLSFSVKRGELHIFDFGEASAYQVSRFEQPFHQTIQPAGSFIEAPYKKRVEDMSRSELRDLMTRRAERGARKGRPSDDFLYRKAWIESAQRFAVPFASVAFALVALPLGIMTRRGGRASGFAISLLVIILYWITFTIGRDLALEGTLPLFAGTWGANIVLLAAGGVLLLARQRYEAFTALDGLLARFRIIASRLPGLRTGFAAGGAFRAGGIRVHRLAASFSGWRLLPRAPIVDRYVAGLFIRILVLVVLSVYVLVWVVVCRDLLNALTDRAVSPLLLLRYVIYFSPGAAWFILPISSVVAALTAISLLEKNNEVTALRTAGISVYRVAAPVLAATMAVCAVYYIVQDLVAPTANQEALRVEDMIEGRTATVTPGVRWIFGQDRRLYAYRDYDPSARVFQGLSVLEFADRGRSVRRRTWIDRASWNGKGWLVEKGWGREWNRGETYRSLEGRTLRYPEGPDFFSRREESFLRGSRLHEQMSFQQLLGHLRATRRSGYDTTHLKVALYAKTAFPFTPLVMVLIGLPFAFRLGRKGSLYGLGVALGLVIVYWALFAVFNALGLEGVVAAPVAAWAPNLLFALAGTYMLLSVPS